MIQDIAPHKLGNQFGNYTIKEDDYVLFFDSGKLGVKLQEDKLSFLTYRELLSEQPEADGQTQLLEVDHSQNDFQYLLELDGRHIWLANDEYEKLNAKLTYIERYQLRSLKPKEYAFAAITAMHLCGWYVNNQFCGKCGSKLVPGDKERSMVCSCGNVVYPRINPAVIVGVTDGDKLLLTKYRGRAYRNYALIAGFTEIGETVEETVAREVMEETGVKVKNIRYYKTQPWGFTDTLLMGYFCELEGSPEIKMDEEELSVAEWVKREDLDVIPDDLSLTNEMICKFIEGI